MKIVIDMNLSPSWVMVLNNDGFEAVHWSEVGDPRAEDSVIMNWARENAHIVFTNDLDFGALLAASNSFGPSVIQARTQDVSPRYLAPLIVSTLLQYKEMLEEGALIVVDEGRFRVRILPLR